MRKRKHRASFYTIVALLVVGTTSLGGWLINSSMTKPQYSTMSEPEEPENVAPPSPSSSPSWVDDYFNRALAYMQNRQYAQAVLVWNELLLKNDSIPEVHVNQGFSLFEMGHIEPASRHFQRALELNSYQINAYYGLAICFEAMEELEAAMGAMRSFIHLADENDPFIRKARSALWEWESRTDRFDIDGNPANPTEKPLEAN
jgi:tetratricopeptide (TPR) repeat protein